jgi:hypothetical protein
MKRRLIALFCAAIAGPLSAQPNFKLTCSPILTQTTKTYPSQNGNYLLKEYDKGSDKSGKINLYTPEHKKLASISFSFDTKARDFLVAPIHSKDKLLLFTAPLHPAWSGPGSSPCAVMWNEVPQEPITIQQYDPSTLKPVGLKRTIAQETSKKNSSTIVRSPNGVYFALIEHAFPEFSKIKYTLFKEGEQIFTKEIAVEGYSKPAWINLDGDFVVMSNTGDLAVSYSQYYQTFPHANLLMISASTQKAVFAKLKVNGKMTYEDPYLLFTDDGNLLVAATYAKIEKRASNYEGIVVETFSPQFEKVKHVEIPFNNETLTKCANTIRDKTTVNELHDQQVQKVLPVPGGYVIVSEQETSVSVAVGANNSTTVTAYGNLVCQGISSDLKEQYQTVIRSIDKRSTFILFQAQNAHAIGNRVYIFHPGNDDSVKNTPDEFALYCTSWENGSNTPKTNTVKVPRTNKDLFLTTNQMFNLSANKLLFKGQLKNDLVWTTMEITE